MGVVFCCEAPPWHCAVLNAASVHVTCLGLRLFVILLKTSICEPNSFTSENQTCSAFHQLSCFPPVG